MYELWEKLEELKKYRWIELSHPLNNHSPYWAGIPEGAVELGKTAYDWGNELECLIQTFKFPGQFGTHIDFPGHFVKGEPLSEQYTVRNMAYPLVVIDVSEKVKEDVHYAVTVEDIKAYEEAYGDIPDGAFVALRTGWSERWPDMDAISNVDENGGGSGMRKIPAGEGKIAGRGHVQSGSGTSGRRHRICSVSSN